MPVSADDPVQLEVVVLSVRGESARVEYDGNVYTLPRSQIETHADLALCDHRELVDIEIPEWLAFERGMI